jgi:hypothetical protein
MRGSKALSVAIVLAGLGSSCAPAPSPVVPVHNAVDPQPGLQVHKTAAGTRISGPDLDVVRDEEGFHGHGPLGPVELREGWSRNYSGVVGSGLDASATDLHVDPIGDGYVNINGLFAGQRGELEVRSDRIYGYFGHCYFDLRNRGEDATGRAYEGFRQCGRQAHSASLTLSPDLAKLSARDRGAVIALTLGR